MPSVNMVFFADVLALLERRFGKRAASQQQLNGLIEAAGELEREFLACPLMPASEEPAVERHHCEWCGAEWEGDDRAD